eukprot:PITA_13340
MGPQGLYLNKWTPDFDPAVDVPKVVPVWVRLPNLPVHCWNWDSLKHIGNALGKFIYRAKSKDQYDCARICVEVDLEEGHPEAIKIKVGNWTHVQKLGYEQFPFKCWICQKSGGNTSKGLQQDPQQTQQPQPSFNLENRFDPLNSQPEDSHEVAVQRPKSPDKGSQASSAKDKEAVESSKGTPEVVEEEDQESEESEEEGEIGESESSVRRSTRERKTDREKREHETYNEKLQGSQPTLEKLLAKKPKAVRNQHQGSKGAQPYKEASNTHWEMLNMHHVTTKEILCLFNVYVPVNSGEKKSCWDSLRQQADLVTLENVIIAGDLNTTLHSSEKRGGSIVRDSAREWVEDLLQDWDLLDIKPFSGMFTWSNKRIGPSHIVARQIDSWCIAPFFCSA